MHISHPTPHRYPTSTSMELKELAVPAVYALIFFLGYPSQLLFLYLEPGPLSKNELIISNVLLVCIFITYTQSVYVDPGTISENYGEKNARVTGQRKANSEKNATQIVGRVKWCRKCDAAKPPRAHHCKECKRYECLPDKLVHSYRPFTCSQARLGAHCYSSWHR